MGNSRKLNSNSLLEHLADILRPGVPAGSSILLGLSGGLDSVVLLHLLRQLSSRHSWRLSALHVHHGISSQADNWAAFCAELCAREEIPLKIEHVNIAPLRQMGVEAAARELRHAALERQQADFIALAHHQDDQVETLLLQLLRGAGVRGASAMPIAKQRAGLPALLRPLLGVARSTLTVYARQHDLQWVEDESNSDDAYPRNFLRHRILPLLEQRFPAYRATLARSARHAAEASVLLDELARLDATEAMSDGHLDVAKLCSLSIARSKNLLRHYLAAQGAPVPGSARLEEMRHQLCQARSDAAIHLVLGEWEIRRYRGRVYAFPAPPKPPTEFQAQWNGETSLEFPELNGLLCFQAGIGQGLNPKKLRQNTVHIHLRRGGESIQPDAARPRRTLKNLLQELTIPPWQRDLLPLLFCGEELVCVPGVAIAHEYRVRPDEEGVSVSWRQRLC